LENIDIFYGHYEYFTDFGIFCDHLVHFLFIWYIFPVLVSCGKKNLATLVQILLKVSVQILLKVSGSFLVVLGPML
jgi:hypothetical protein